jgi:hypothetical protein
MAELAWRHAVAAAVAAADSRMPSLTPVFFVLLTECSLHVAQNTHFKGLPSGILEQINLAHE